MEKIKAINILIDDELEAIEGYEKYLNLFTEQERYVIAQIIKDEQKHIKLLKEIKNEKN